VAFAVAQRVQWSQPMIGERKPPSEKKVSGIYAKTGAVDGVAAHILRGVVAAFHCRDHLDSGRIDAARREYHVLEHSLEAIARSAILPSGGDAGDERVAMLEKTAGKLRLRLATAVVRSA
jgi:hypothetical protein